MRTPHQTAAAPGDPRTRNARNTPALGSAFAAQLPELALPWQAMRLEHPAIRTLNEPLARELGLDPQWLRSEQGTRWLIGVDHPEGSRHTAQAYAGHQFGAYTPRLGDGRALLLGDLTDTHGRPREVHLKGSGRTPFARSGDGLAALGPMLREHLMGEAMHALGIPTTRALAVVATGQRVIRDLDALPGAVLTRVAASHLRVGTFQYARALGDTAVLRRLADLAIDRHYPALTEGDSPYLGLLTAVIEAQARLVASWMLVGFVHGVMNTDNTAISGETIDYGPCAFLDAYDPAAVFSSIDTHGRYAYGAQAAIAGWNLTRFAETLLPLIAEETDGDPETAEGLAVAALHNFGPAYDTAWTAGIRAKLGLAAHPVEDHTVIALAAELLRELAEGRIDYTRAFRALAETARAAAGGSGDAGGAGDRGAGAAIRYKELLGGAGGAGGWLEAWLALSPDPDAMDAVNPLYIARNHLVDEALAAASDGDLAPFEAALAAVTRPFAPRPGLEAYALPGPPGRPHITYCGT
ncbi:protein adenylyltransferase SelO [Leucobacter sp. VD1]|uniref:protein adenylyltransferase SelO n=1 Tax=Leucobacter sp. VD1 TaxID=3080381 RepID=UPI0030179C50